MQIVRRFKKRILGNAGLFSRHGDNRRPQVDFKKHHVCAAFPIVDVANVYNSGFEGLSEIGDIRYCHEEKTPCRRVRFHALDCEEFLIEVSASVGIALLDGDGRDGQRHGDDHFSCCLFVIKAAHGIERFQRPEAIPIVNELNSGPLDFYREVVAIENDDPQRHDAAGQHVLPAENLCGKRIREERIDRDCDPLAGELCRIGIDGARRPGTYLVPCGIGECCNRGKQQQQPAGMPESSLADHIAPSGIHCGASAHPPG